MKIKIEVSVEDEDADKDEVDTARQVAHEEALKFAAELTNRLKGQGITIDELDVMG